MSIVVENTEFKVKLNKIVYGHEVTVNYDVQTDVFSFRTN